MNKQRIRQAPRVCMTGYAWQKMHLYAQCATGEIAGIGEVQDYPGLLLVTDVMIAVQSAGRAHADIDPGSLAALTARLAQTGKCGAIKYFWHSHGHMSCYFSSIDEATIEAFGTDYLVSTCVNKRGAGKHRLDIFQPERVTFGDLLIRKIDRKRIAEMVRREVEQLVRGSRDDWEALEDTA